MIATAFAPTYDTVPVRPAPMAQLNLIGNLKITTPDPPLPPLIVQPELIPPPPPPRFATALLPFCAPPLAPFAPPSVAVPYELAAPPEFPEPPPPARPSAVPVIEEVTQPHHFQLAHLIRLSFLQHLHRRRRRLLYFVC